MRRILSVFCLAGVLFGASNTSADLTGACNSLLGRMAGDWHRVVVQGDVDQCTDLAMTIGDFVAAGCVPLLDAGDLFVTDIIVHSSMGTDQSLIQAACQADCDCGIVIPECAGVVDCV